MGYVHNDRLLIILFLSSIAKYAHCAHTLCLIKKSLVILLFTYALAISISLYLDVALSLPLYPKTLTYLYNYNGAYPILMDPKFLTASNGFPSFVHANPKSEPIVFPYFVRVDIVRTLKCPFFTTPFDHSTFSFLS
jgi:hypothetical protein